MDRSPRASKRGKWRLGVILKTKLNFLLRGKI